MQELSPAPDVSVEALEEITLRLGAIASDPFEHLCGNLLRAEFPEWAALEPRHNSKGKSTPGTPDAHVRLSDGSYIAFQFTTQSSNLKRKILSDIAKVAAPSCKIGDKVVRLVICLNTPVSDEQEVYRAAAAAHGWELEIFSLQRMTAILSKYPDLCQRFLGKTFLRSSSSEGTRLFLAGERLQVIREDLQMDRGRFAEASGIGSERALIAMEIGESECSETILQSVADLSGASLDWLKYGSVEGNNLSVLALCHGEQKEAPHNQCRYCPHQLTLFHLGRDIDDLREASPERLWFVMEPRTYSVMILVQSNDTRWTTFDTGISLNLWNWIDSFGDASNFSQMVEAVFDNFQMVSSRITTNTAFFAVLNGQAHPSVAVREAKGRGGNWAIDLNDIDHERHTEAEYQKEHGRWFVRAQRAMRDIDQYGEPDKIRRLRLSYAGRGLDWLDSLTIKRVKPPKAKVKN